MGDLDRYFIVNIAGVSLQKWSYRGLDSIYCNIPYSRPLESLTTVLGMVAVL
jgi:hypothetical protein